MRLRHLGTGLLVLALMLGPAAPALASAPATTPVLVSTDGSHFSPTLAAGLFDFAGPLIPGGSAATSLFVRNPTARPMVLTLGTTDISFSNREFADALSVIVTSESAADGQVTAPPVTLGTATRCGVLLTGRRLDPNSTARIDLALAMADVTGSVAQGQSANFDVRVSLRDAEAVPPEDACDSPGVDLPGLSSPGDEPASSTPTQSASARSPLAQTGSDVWPPLLLGTGLLGAGLAILVATRRKRRA